MIEKWKKKIKEELAGLRSQLAIICVGFGYKNRPQEDFDDVGIERHLYWFPEEITTEKLVNEIKDIQNFYNGIIVELPLPPHIDIEAIVEAIDIRKDVDGFHYNSRFPATLSVGIMKYLKEIGFDCDRKHVVIIGSCRLVGQPLVRTLIDAGCTATLCRDKESPFYQIGDLIICAPWKDNFLDCSNITVPVIDVTGSTYNRGDNVFVDCERWGQIALLENTKRATLTQDALSKIVPFVGEEGAEYGTGL